MARKARKLELQEKRILRLKTTMKFGRNTMTAGDYEGDGITQDLEDEFESGSSYVEEVITRVQVSEKSAPNLVPDTELGMGTTTSPAEVVTIPSDLDTSSLKGGDPATVTDVVKE